MKTLLSVILVISLSLFILLGFKYDDEILLMSKNTYIWVEVGLFLIVINSCYNIFIYLKTIRNVKKKSKVCTYVHTPNYSFLDIILNLNSVVVQQIKREIKQVKGNNNG